MSCFVYVISVSDDNGQPLQPCKIGISDDPARRLKALQTSHYSKLILVCSFVVPTKEIARSLEAAFHQINAGKRLAGEWFDIPVQLAVFLMCANLRAALEHLIPEEMFQEAAEASGLLEIESQIYGVSTIQ